MKNWSWTLPYRFRRSESLPGGTRARAADRKPRSFRPQFEKLEARLAPAITALGAGPGVEPLVTILDDSGAFVTSFDAYDPRFTGGINVATGDVNGDGTVDIITAPRAGGGPHIKVFDGVTFDEIHSFFAYDPAFTGGVNVASADLNGDREADIITGAGAGGGPHVKVFDRATLQEAQSFFAYDPRFTGGVNVAAGDLNGDRVYDVITGAGAGGGPHVKAFDGVSGNEVISFFAYDPAFTGGVNVGTGGIRGDGTLNLITGPGRGGGPDVRIWEAGQNPELIGLLRVFDGADTSGVNVGSIPGFPGSPDKLAVTRESSPGPLEVYNLAGELLFTSTIAGGGVQGFSISSDAAQPIGFGQGGAPPPVMPTDKNQGKLTDVLFDVYAWAKQHPDVENAKKLMPKTLTITNNSTQPVYPFLRGVNDGKFSNGAFYDNQKEDPNNQEYRAYLGYYDDSAKAYVFGLQPGMQIVVTVPLVFWDGARIHFSQDTTYFTNDRQRGVPGAAENNPYNYFKLNQDGTQTRRYIDTDPTRVTSVNTAKPAVFYYHASIADEVHSEAPDQLLEVTIRDPIQRDLNPALPDPTKDPNIGYLGPLFNYDNSFVDSLAFPATLEAPKVPLLIDHTRTASFGWIGAPQSFDQFKTAIENFTSHDPAKNGLGQYFGGQGWNTFFVPSPGTMGVKIPATKNIYELSPLGVHASIYRGANNQQYHVLASGGVWYQVDTFGTGTFKKGDSEIQNVNEDMMKRLASGMLTNEPDFFPNGTSIQSLDFGKKSITLAGGKALRDSVQNRSYTFIGSQFGDHPGTLSGTELKLTDTSLLPSLKVGMVVQIPVDKEKPELGLKIIGRIASFSAGTIKLEQAPVDQGAHSFTFSGAITDYAAQKLLNLWYAWADYWRRHVISLNPFAGQDTQTIQNGAIAAATVQTPYVRDITFQTDVSNLQPGMTVTDTQGIVPAHTTISSVNKATKTVSLSQYALKTGLTAAFTFGKPIEIPRSGFVPSEDNNPLKLDFSNATAAEKAKAIQFAPVVYSVMQEWSLIPQLTADISGLSNNVQIQTANTIHVGSTNGFAKSGTLQVQVKDGPPVTVTYTDTTSTSFTGVVAQGSGTMLAGGLVSPLPLNVPFDSLAFMQNIIGGNIGKLPLGLPVGVKQDTTDLGKLYTRQSKSLERGVYDFIDVDEGQWYPEPAAKTPGVTTGGSAAEFNIYNLDPYVWFIHRVLGVSGYAFSLDDDKADVGATGSHSLQIVIGGITVMHKGVDIGLPNKAEWSPGVRYGPQSSLGTPTVVEGGAHRITDLQNRDLSNFLAAPDSETPGALVLGPGVQPGTRITKIDASLHFVELSQKRVNPPSGQQKYSFYAPVHATGTINPSTASNAITNLDPDVIGVLNAITANSSLVPGALTVIGPGISANAPPAPAVPTITGFSATSGPQGTQVTITGTNFVKVAAVAFNGTPTTNFRVKLISPTEIVATVPTGATSGKIGVSALGGTAVSASDFTVTAPTSAPTINSISPLVGAPGTLVTITGANLSNITSVNFGGAHATPASVTATQLTVVVPAGAVTDGIGIGGGGADASSSAIFTVDSKALAPAIYSFIPASGPVGSMVAIYGLNFLQVSAVAFNGLATTAYIVDSPTEIRVTVPAGASSGPIGVAAQGGVVASSGSFTVTAAPPPSGGVTRVAKVNASSVELDQPLNPNQAAGEYRFKFE